MTMQENFTAADLTPLEYAADAAAAREILLDILLDCENKARKKNKTINPYKMGHLKNQVQKCRTKADVMALGWNVLLSGEGLYSLDSKYQKKASDKFPSFKKKG